MFEGIMVGMICEINQLFDDMKFLYSQLIKAVFGTLLGVVIFYNKLSKYLTDHGFTQNKYDMCIFYKMVNREQLIVQFHTEDRKVLHKG